MTIINIILLFSKIIDKIYIGAIFCHVINTIHIFHLSLDKTSGNHIWNGGIPIFIIIVINIMIFGIFILFILIKIYLFNKIIIINIVDAILWIKKYIILLWERKLFFDLNINGIKDIILISNPIHIFNQFLDLITIIVLIMVIIINNIFLDVFIIKKKKIFFYT